MPEVLQQPLDDPSGATTSMPFERLKILIVDDEPEGRLKVRGLLEDRFTIAEASSREEACDLALLWRADCVLLAVSRPDLETFSLLSALAGRGCPAVLLTGGCDSLEAAARAGAEGYLSKEDITLPLLERTIRFAVNAARRRAQESESRLRFEALYHAEAEIRQDLEAEMQLAREIQFGLLPQRPPTAEGFDIHGLFVPSRATSGDFLDYYTSVDGQRLELLLGDVTGHGLGPALLSIEIRASLRALAQLELSEAEMFRIVNRMAHEHTSDMRFASAFLGRLDIGGSRLQFACAGHDAHVLRASGERVRLQARGLPLGAMAESHYEGAQTDLQPGDILLAMTDGVYEARRPDGALLGCDACLRAAEDSREASAANLCGLILRTVQEFSEREDLVDDATILVVKACG